jgi:hypothetical protein
LRGDSPIFQMDATLNKPQEKLAPDTVHNKLKERNCVKQITLYWVIFVVATCVTASAQRLQPLPTPTVFPDYFPSPEKSPESNRPQTTPDDVKAFTEKMVQDIRNQPIPSPTPGVLESLSWNGKLKEFVILIVVLIYVISQRNERLKKARAVQHSSSSPPP